MTNENKPLFERSGFEVDLACNCVVTQFMLLTLDEVANGKNAAGTITVKDYPERGITFTREWAASQARGSSKWEVVNVPTDFGAVFVDPDTEEPLFTRNGTINRAMKEYIERWTEGYWLFGTESATELVQYDGEMHAYEGDCVCVRLSLSSVRRPFPWKEMTGGAYPKNCFRCSCGTRWYCIVPDEKVWAVVVDPVAWDQLIKYDGKPVQKLSNGGACYVYRMQTIVDNGFIPLP